MIHKRWGMMVIIFWVITGLLLICALGFILPSIRLWRIKVLVACILSLCAYFLYFQYGKSQYLVHYYSAEEQLQRNKQASFRRLLAEFRKEEFRLKLRLEENPKDLEAEWRLLDLLAIKAIYHRDYSQAIQYWKQALEKIPKNAQNKDLRDRITQLITEYN